ncbi:MAG: hypothetical protein GY950_18570, partial [bacterium]|nr:hypothetical protein [bacterium]
LHELLKGMDERISWISMPVDTDKKSLRLDRAGAERLAKEAVEWDLLQHLPFNASPKACKAVSKGLYAVGYYESRPCYMPWLNFFISPAGFVYPCCMSRGNIRALGKLPEQSVAEILDGPPVKAMRVAMAAGQPMAVCHRCDDVIEENSNLYRWVRKNKNPSMKNSSVEGASVRL